MYRQGDVLLIPCGEVDTTDMKRRRRDHDGRVILAYGERTGHAHAVKERKKDDAVIFDNGRGFRILAVASEAELVHEEHKALAVPPGNYEIRNQLRVRPGEGIVPAARID